MMKFIGFIIFMNFMLFKNNMIMFYYNLCYLSSLMMIFNYMFKDNIYFNMSMMFSFDYYSIWLIILNSWVIGLMMMCLMKKELMKMIMFINLMMILMLFFSSIDLLVFYMWFEISLIPTFMLIIYWGLNKERTSAAYYLMMYMLFISFPFLLYMFNMYFYSMSFKFSLMNLVMNYYHFNVWSFIMIYMAFFIKMPIYLLHVWLPKAHVEAPVYGSMILAAILLKMGSYGLIRLMEMLLYSSIKYMYVIFCIGILGSMLISVLCMAQIDMKSLVAYSSVVHMNLMLCSMGTFFKLGFISSYIMMISHGLCSSGLFYMVNLYYERTSSRLLILNKGMLSKLPLFSMWWFLFCAANFSFPFSLNFISEILTLGVILSWDLILMIYLFIICFFSGAYSLYLYSYVQHGHFYVELYFISSLFKEFMVLIIHFFPLIFMLLNLIMFM
uniref:NADH-ubiquinone oxidoreductase chain 4 n=1 Tax=Myrmica scabrinodis TaxID=207696 RepID=A0A0A8P135_9HYME|nr:NADH dehydrogenase subunit 4 [Myrmica scabrinodis]CEF49548.1 NADH dehydrogenase subunit 4 [Myrmica scabrinodis]